jgi:hypothetical protein
MVSPTCDAAPLDGRIYALNLRTGEGAGSNTGSSLFYSVLIPTGLPQANKVHYNYTGNKLDVEVCPGGGTDCLELPQVDATMVSYMTDDDEGATP